MLHDISKMGVVILAAGKGTRLGCTDKPKVMLEIGGRPIVSYIVETLFEMGFTKEQIVLVVGFQKETVKKYFKDAVSYAVQEEQKGTAHAAYVGSRTLASHVDQMLVVNGDDSAFYTTETLENFISQHLQSQSTVSVLTVESGNPALGRVVKGDDGVIRLVEKENLTDEQKLIKENNTGTYCIEREWFEKSFLKMKPVRGLGEYGLNTILEMAQQDGLKVLAIKLADNSEWLWINTPEELNEANKRKTA